MQQKTMRTGGKAILFFAFLFVVLLGFSSFASAACTEHNVSYGDSVNSAIDASDCETSPSGSGHYSEVAVFSAVAGDQITADAHWSSFNGFLWLTDSDDNWIGYNDDYYDAGSDSYDTTRSLITATVWSSGVYHLWMTTNDPGDTGNYSITLDRYVDHDPDYFGFTDEYSQPLNTLVTSQTQTISGFEGVLTASVSGDGNPKIEINNSGNWVTSGNIEDGQSLRVQLTSSSNYSESFSALVSVGAD
jgi:hypothetical protein